MADSVSAALAGLLSLDAAQRRAAAQYFEEHPSRPGCDALIGALGDPNPGAHAAILRALTRQSDPELISLLVNVLRDENPNRRIAAQTALLETCRQDPDAPLRALRHPTTEVRLWAAETLGELAEPRAVQALTEHLNDTAEFPTVRRAAAQALGRIGEADATPALLAAAAHGDFWMRQAAVEALSRIGDERAVEPLLEVMRQDPWTQPLIIKALGSIGNDAAVPELVSALSDAEQEPVRAAALEALLKIVLEPVGRRPGTPKTAKLRPLIPAEPLRRELTARVMPNSAYAAHLLGWLGKSEALPDLIEALSATEDGLRDAAVEALLRFGPTAVPTLAAALERPEPSTRERAAELLGLLGDPGAAPALARHLHDDPLSVRQAVLSALTALGGDTAYAGILHAIVEAETRDMALALLSQLHNETIISTLKNYLQRHLYEGAHGPEVRWAAARALSLLGDEAAVSILLNATRLPDDSVRKPAAEALAWVRGRRAVNVLIEALGDRDWLVRQKAVEALSGIQDSRAVAALLPLANDPEWRVRLAVVTALCRMRDARIYDPLLKLTQDSDRWVRRTAIEMCAPLDDPRATDIVLRGLKDADVNIRLAALTALRWRRDPALALPIAELSGDPQPHVRQAALHTLARVTGTAGLDHIILMASDPVEIVRAEVAYVLGELGSEEALPALETLLRDQERSVRLQALEALAHIGTQTAIEALAEALTNPNIKTDAQAQLRALGEPALRLLLGTARSASPELRAASAETLGQLGDAHALSTLRQLLRDPDLRVRQAAEAAARAIETTRAPSA